MDATSDDPHSVGRAIRAIKALGEVYRKAPRGPKPDPEKVDSTADRLERVYSEGDF